MAKQGHTDMTSAVLIIPDSYKDSANSFGVSQGWGEGNFSVPLSTSGLQPATHWGCRAEVTQSFVDMVENPSPENTPLVSVLIYSFSDTMEPYDHWIETLTSEGLKLADVQNNE